ncbi:uncharacterized protein METZ01_LOCUS74613 [marine metagenome]|uniref:Uncharacterized protein n=1 Tax=marine metagenome TaxID=408172 RepID=A0A381U0V8_9ZZZZ
MGYRFEFQADQLRMGAAFAPQHIIGYLA